MAGLSLRSGKGLGGPRPSVEAWWIDGFTNLILRAVRKEDMFVLPRIPDTVPPAVAPTIEKALANEAAFEANLGNWLSQRRKR